jgi:hypothetical protein
MEMSDILQIVAGSRWGLLDLLANTLFETNKRDDDKLKGGTLMQQ